MEDQLPRYRTQTVVSQPAATAIAGKSVMVRQGG
jgi:hypothetical protein